MKMQICLLLFGLVLVNKALNNAIKSTSPLFPFAHTRGHGGSAIKVLMKETKKLMARTVLGLTRESCEGFP